MTKKKTERRFTPTAQEILSHATALTLLLRDASKDDLEQARDCLQEFSDSWLKSGDGQALPLPAGAEWVWCDVDVTDRIVEAIDVKLEYAE